MIKVGLIGTGTIAREHAAALRALQGRFALAGAADVSAERLNEFCRAFNVRPYNSAQELLADKSVDLVAIATPPSSHEAAAVAALEAGKYVLCEKPLAHSLAAAARISEVADRHPGKLAVCYQLRFSPEVRRMIWLVQNGWIGEVREAVVERHGYVPTSVMGRNGWWGRWDVSGGGVLMSQMIHQIDIMLQAMGEACSVSAKMGTRYSDIESEDCIEAKVEFEKGRTARIEGSVNSGQMRGRLTISGTLGTVSQSGMQLNDPDRRVQALRALNAALPATQPVSQSLPARGIRKLRRTLLNSKEPSLNDHARMYLEIADSITHGHPLPVSAKDALPSLQLCSGAYEAAATGHLVGLPLQQHALTYAGMSRSVYEQRVEKYVPAAPSIIDLPKSNVVRLGLIGLDTTHAPTFTDLLHNPYNGDHIPGAKIVAAFPGGSLDMHVSASRVGGFTATLRDRYGVPILDSPEKVADAADVVFILSSDGRMHPGLFQSVAGRGRPVFIDKPFATSRADAELIFDIARSTGTRVFASSAFRYADGLVTALNEIHSAGEKITSCKVVYWGQIEPTQGRFFWYGIHGAEMLMAAMGPGLKSVLAKTGRDVDIIEVEHADGRRSTMIGQHNDGTFHITIETDRRTIEIDIGGPISARILAAALDVLAPGGYPRLWRASDAGSVTGRRSRRLDPNERETLAIVSLLEAGQESLATGTRVALI